MLILCSSPGCTAGSGSCLAQDMLYPHLESSQVWKVGQHVLDQGGRVPARQHRLQACQELQQHHPQGISVCVLTHVPCSAALLSCRVATFAGPLYRGHKLSGDPQQRRHLSGGTLAQRSHR